MADAAAAKEGGNKDDKKEDTKDEDKDDKKDARPKVCGMLSANSPARCNQMLSIKRV